MPKKIDPNLEKGFPSSAILTKRFIDAWFSKKELDKVKDIVTAYDPAGDFIFYLSIPKDLLTSEKNTKSPFIGYVESSDKKKGTFSIIFERNAKIHQKIMLDIVKMYGFNIKDYFNIEALQMSNFNRILDNEAKMKSKFSEMVERGPYCTKKVLIYKLGLLLQEWDVLSRDLERFRSLI